MSATTDFTSGSAGLTSEAVGVAGSQADIAYAALRDMLVTLKIRPGEPLGEIDLTRSIGVGRTPLREAVNRLADERLVAKYPRRGTFAAEINLADLPLLTDLRVEVEGLAAASAATRATEADRAELLRLSSALPSRDTDVEHADGAGDQMQADHQMQVDMAIHRAIYTSAHNPFLFETATRYHNLSTRIWYVFMDRLSSLHSHVEEHRALIDHILAGRPVEARQVARDHVTNFSVAVRDLL